MLSLIRNTIIQYVEIDPETINEDTRLIQDVNLNSYDIVNVIGDLEDELDIEIPDEDLRNMVTVGDVINYLKDKV